MSIDTAIRACKEEKGDVIPGRAQQQRVKGDRYCDILGNVGDLVRLREFDVPYQPLRLRLIEMFKVRWRKSGSIVPRVRPLKSVGGDNLTNLDADISDPTKLLKEKKDVIIRFIGVMMPILNLCQLPLAVVHIFYDLGGSAVTFNRNGSIFVNLRHYEYWGMHHLLCLRHLRSSSGFKQMIAE